MKTLISKYLIHPFIKNKLKWRKEVAKLSKELKEYEKRTKNTLIQLQQKKLKILFNEAYKNVPFYRKLFDENGIDPSVVKIDYLQTLPIVERQLIKENFNDFVNKSIDESFLKRNATGGSSGEPLQFLTTIRSRLFNAALADRGFRWTGFMPGERHVKLWGAPTDVTEAKGNIKKRVLEQLLNRETLDAFAQSDRLFENMNLKFRKRSPSLLESYVNILYEFALFLERRQYRSLNIPIVICSAGTLYEFQRKKIKQQISDNVFNRYGSREFGSIAHECSCHDGMHVNMERFILEINNADEDGVGDILITDLENIGFPFIRYRIGDRGSITHEVCSCGKESIRLAQVVGRSLDLIRTPSGKIISGQLFPHYFKDYPQIILGQVIQEKLDDVQIRLKLVQGYDINELSELSKRLSDIIGPGVRISLVKVNNLITNPTGKYRPVISNLND